MAKKKKITPKQHGAAIVKLMRVTQKSIDKFLALKKRDDISEEEKNAAAEEGLQAMRKANSDFDKIDKEFKEQEKK